MRRRMKDKKVTSDDDQAAAADVTGFMKRDQAVSVRLEVLCIKCFSIKSPVCFTSTGLISDIQASG